jgi:uncharacterized membrane protein
MKPIRGATSRLENLVHVTDLTTLMTNLALGRGRSTALSPLLMLVGLLLVGLSLLKGMPGAIQVAVLSLLTVAVAVALFA